MEISRPRMIGSTLVVRAPCALQELHEFRALRRRDIDEEIVGQVRAAGVRCQSPFRSLRRMPSSSSTMMPVPKATSCTTLSARRRLRLATPKRHATPTRPRRRPAR